jgi:Ubiquinone biosynthesis protein COQ7
MPVTGSHSDVHVAAAIGFADGAEPSYVQPQRGAGCAEEAPDRRYDSSTNMMVRLLGNQGISVSAPSNANKVVQRILRVNHAGEQGAIAIYGAQISGAKSRYPDLLPWLEETLGHEKKHRDAFLELMSPRGITPCPVASVRSIGGAVLGFVTAPVWPTWRRRLHRRRRAHRP